MVKNSKVKSLFIRAKSKIFLRLSGYLVKFGIADEPRWVKLNLNMKNGKSQYLKDDHRNRDWYCDYLSDLNSPSVLEIGAGGMHEIGILKERNELMKYNYNILDISEEVVLKGKEIFPEVDFHLGSINSIPFPDNSFDVVYCRHVIEHQPEYTKPILEIMRVTRKIAIINVFRWTMTETIVRREKKYSNSYNIHELLKFCETHSNKFCHFILLKNDSPGKNMYSDQNIIRSRDHLILIMIKSSSTFEKLESSLKEYKPWLIYEPYKSESPIYFPEYEQ
jgi:ubiquinone/menaquinone biosynthesis C-methylase UbiE